MFLYLSIAKIKYCNKIKINLINIWVKKLSKERGVLINIIIWLRNKDSVVEPPSS